MGAGWGQSDVFFGTDDDAEGCSSGFGLVAAGCALMTERSSWPSSRSEKDEQRLTVRATRGLLWLLLLLLVVGTWRSAPACSADDFRGLIPATKVCKIRSQKLAFSERGTRLWDLGGSAEAVACSGSSVTTTVKGFSWDWELVGLGEGVTSKPILSRCSLGLATMTGQSGGGAAGRERFSFMR